MANKEHLSNMQEHIIKMIELELLLSSADSLLARIIRKFVEGFSYRTKDRSIEVLMVEVNKIIGNIAKYGINRGKKMAVDTMMEYIKKGSNPIHKSNITVLVDRANRLREEDRMELYEMETKKETESLKADINIFWKHRLLIGLLGNEILKQLIIETRKGEGPIAVFSKRMQTIGANVLRREASASEINEYLKISQPGELWQWITVSSKPCPDCEIRAGVTLPMNEWKSLGLPGDGRTICRSSCMCKLLPVSIAEELFPDVKTFRWNKSSGVLTTNNEKAIFRKNEQ